MTQSYNIKVWQTSKQHGKQLALEGPLTVDSKLSEHDLAAVVFAMEFAINNHAELPLRIHIEETP